MRIESRCRITILCLCALAAVSMPRASEDTACLAPLGEVLYMSNSGVELAQFRLIDNEQDWCELWDDAFSEQDPAPACDTSMVDFRFESVIVAAVGWGGTGCGSTRIECIDRHPTANSATASIVTTEAGYGCACPAVAVLWAPLHIVKVEKHVKRVDFTFSSVTQDCGGGGSGGGGTGGGGTSDPNQPTGGGGSGDPVQDVPQ